MKPEEFCYWLMGSLELGNVTEMDKEQTKVLKRHLDMVFTHVAHLEENTSYEIGNFKPDGTVQQYFHDLKPGERC